MRLASHTTAVRRRLWSWGRRVGPVVISLGLVAWLVWTVTPRKLGEALAAAAWPWLVFATVVQAIVLFSWDTLNLWWLFRQPDGGPPFRTFLRARTDSVIWSAVNLEVGQAAFAWTLARQMGQPVPVALGRCFAMALFDFGTLMSLALVGSFLHTDPLLATLRWVPVGGVSGLTLLFVVWHVLPAKWRQRVASWELTEWVAWWRWRHGILLAIQRLTLFLLVLVYAGICLHICRCPADVRTIAGVIPFVIIAESLPGTGGLGERETALVFLMRPVDEEQRATLLSFGLIWSVVVILGRIVIGAISRSLPRRDASPQAS